MSDPLMVRRPGRFFGGGARAGGGAAGSSGKRVLRFRRAGTERALPEGG